MKTRKQYLQEATTQRVLKAIQNAFRHYQARNTIIAGTGKEVVTLWEGINAAIRNERKRKSNKSKP